MYRYEEQFVTRQHEMGPHKHIRVQAICNYMEEIAGIHADNIGLGMTDLAQFGITWVLAKLRLNIHHLPSSGEVITASTWTAGVERLRCKREYSFADARGNLIITGLSYWLTMNLETRKVERIPEAIQKRFPLEPDAQTSSPPIKVGSLSTPVEGPVFPVRLADIDQNNHVNNVRYIDFILECAHAYGYPSAGRKYPALRQLDIEFKAESRYGDTIASYTAADEASPHALLHSLCNAKTGTELVRVRSLWE